MALLSHIGAEMLAHIAMGVAVNSEATQDNRDSLKIVGFGACMIGGFPDVSESFFDIACNFVMEKRSCSIESAVKSLHGFSAPRAEKHLKKILCLKPDYVVFQFGSSDASSSLDLTRLGLRRRVPAGTGLKRALPPSYKHYSPTPLTLIRWQASSFIGIFLDTTPSTDPQSFILAYERMIGECILADATPVILSPFIFGTRHSMNSAIRYGQLLHELCLKMDGSVFVDCITLLSKFPKSQILLNDAMHLRQLGHQLVGQAVGEAILDDIAAKSTAPGHAMTRRQCESQIGMAPRPE